MFQVNADKSIYITRGDIACIEISAMMSSTESYVFKPGDIVRFKVFEKKKCENVVLEKRVEALEEVSTMDIILDKTDTKIGETISKPVNYWYEVELNPDTAPQTIVGYDEEGPKIFRLFPEGGETE